MSIKKPKVEVNLIATNVDNTARATTLEGVERDIKYILLVDYDIFGDPSLDSVGDKYTLVLTKESPVRIPRTAKRTPAPIVSKKPGVRITPRTNPFNSKPKKLPSGTCPGSGALVEKRHRAFGKKSECRYCHRIVSTNLDGTYRKHTK